MESCKVKFKNDAKLSFNSFSFFSKLCLAECPFGWIKHSTIKVGGATVSQDFEVAFYPFVNNTCLYFD